MSAWVDDALRMKLEHERRLEALAELIRDYEKEHGEITGDEIRSSVRRMRARAAPVRGRSAPRKQVR